MTFGEEWGWGAGEAESRKVFEAFAERGGNFIDTANHYTAGTSESYVGRFVGSERDRFVIATKYTLNQFPDDPNGGGNHRKNMVQSLEASLRRLGTDYVDLYWVHAWDFLTPVDEVMRALDDLVRAGKIHYVGISDAPAWVVSQANTLADLKGWSPFAALQIQYSLIERTPERDLLPMAKALDIAVTPWAILGGGTLSGKYADGVPEGTRFSEGTWGEVYLAERNMNIAAEVGAVARETGHSSAQVAIAWMRQQDRGVIIPIVGARKVSQIEDNLGGLELELSGDQLARLDEASAVDLGFPHDFLAREDVRQVVYGNTPDLIDNHRS
jgi:aryl-alcohol dehydrogenase-like predicted oxidoreductase